MPAPRQAPQEVRAAAAVEAGTRHGARPEARPHARPDEEPVDPSSGLIPTTGARHSGPIPTPRASRHSGPIPAPRSPRHSGPIPTTGPGGEVEAAPPARSRTSAPARRPTRRPEGEGRPAPWPTVGPAPRPHHPERVRVPLHHTPGAGVPRGPATVGRPSLQVGSAADWATALLGALAVLAVLALPGAVLAVTVGVTDGGPSAGGSPLLLLPVAVALGVGGAVGVTVGSIGLGATVAATPLLVTGAAVAVGAALVVARHRPAVDVPLQAARTLVLFLAGLTAVALTGRAAAGDGTLTVAVAPTLVGGAVWFGGALALAIAWRRPDALPPALRGVRDLLAGPVAGLGAILGSCWLAGLALVVAGVLARSGAVPTPGDLDGSTPPVVAVLLVIVFAPTALLVAFAVALGVPLTPRLPFADGQIGLTQLLGEGPSWWLAPLVAGVVCTLGGMVAALQAPGPDAAVRRGWALGPALALLLAAAVPATTVVAGPFGLQLDLATGVVLGLAWGTVGGLLGAIVAPGLPPALRSGRLGPGTTTAGQVAGVAVVVLFLAAALVVGFATAARLG